MFSRCRILLFRQMMAILQNIYKFVVKLSVLFTFYLQYFDDSYESVYMNLPLEPLHFTGSSPFLHVLLLILIPFSQ